MDCINNYMTQYSGSSRWVLPNLTQTTIDWNKHDSRTLNVGRWCDTDVLGGHDLIVDYTPFHTRYYRWGNYIELINCKDIADGDSTSYDVGHDEEDIVAEDLDKLIGGISCKK